MALIHMPPSWGLCTSNLTGTPSATPGTTVTAGASNADGSNANVLSALGHDCEMLVIGLAGFFTSNSARACLLDVLTDPAGGTSYGTFIDDLICGQTATMSGVSPCPVWYHFPVWIKAGTSIGARARNSTGTTIGGKIIMYAFGATQNPGAFWCGTSVETLGITAASSAGTAHTPGNSGAYSSWASVGSTMSGHCGAVQFGVQREATGTTAVRYYWEIGIGSTRVGTNMWRTTNTTELSNGTHPGVIWCNAPSGSQWQVRATCNGTAQAHGVGIYAVH